MPFNKCFDSALITKINEDAWHVVIKWLSYMGTPSQESFVATSLAEAKTRILVIRCYERITALDENGNPIRL
jgi:hypothetical protein